MIELNKRYSRDQITYIDSVTDIVSQSIQKNILEETGDFLASTTDYADLARFDSQYIFAYGTLKEGFTRHKILKNCDLVAYGYTKSPFSMFKTKDKLTFPVLLYKNVTTSPAYPIFGEIYKVPPYIMRDLDYYENNNFFYKRHKIIIDGIGPDFKKRQYFAWTYIGLREYWQKESDQLEPIIPFKAKKKNFIYYHFTKAHLSK